MKRKVIFTILWVVGFPLAYLILSMVMFAILGEMGFQKKQPSDGVMHLFALWAWLFWLSPAAALVLSVFSLLPGTRRKIEKISHT